MTASTSEKRVSIDEGAPTTIADAPSTQAPSSNGESKSYLYSSPNGTYSSYMSQPTAPQSYPPHSPLSESHSADEHDEHFVLNESDIASPLRNRTTRSNGTSNGKYKSSKKTKRKVRSFAKRCYNRWIKGTMSSFSSLFLAVLLWYGLGVVSIATSKVLLMPAESQQEHQHSHRHHRHHHPLIGGVPPLFLTLQQLCIGSCLLRFLIHVRFLGSPGLAPWPIPTRAPSSRRIIKRSQSVLTKLTDFIASIHFQLLGAGFFFALGFLMTNYGFAGSSATFVETIKAAEPITSATVAVWNGIETLSQPEMASLLAIVCGVVLSTMGNTTAPGQSSGSSSITGTQSAFAQSIQACIIVMIANLSFSFRGLYQKLFRATPEGSTQVVDDLNLQMRMQQIGVGLLIGPVLLYEMGAILIHLGSLHSTHGLWKSGVSTHYLTLSLVNGFAFTCYNLASTYILSRISVVHHAALNCVRRVFAIVMTSIYFMIPVTFVGGTGIVVSMGGEFADGAGSFTKPLFTEVISLIVFSCSTCYSTFFCFQGSCPSLTTK